MITVTRAGKARRRGRWLLATAAALGALLGSSIGTVAPAHAATRLSSLSAVATSETVALSGEAGPRIPAAGPVDVLAGATRAEASSEPRAQADGVTLAVPGAPLLDHRGQCRAAFPDGPTRDTCGPPARPPVDLRALSPWTGGLPLAPDRGLLTGPLTADVLTARVQASGDRRRPELSEARSTAVLAGLALGDVVRARAGASESRSFVGDGAVHAVTLSEAAGVVVAGVLRIGVLRASAEAVHPGDATQGWAAVRTEALDVTVAGVPVTLGPDGLEVEGRPLPPASGAASAAARRVAGALASRGLSVEPLPPPQIAGEGTGGVVEASSPGLRLVLRDPDGGALTLVLGLAQVGISAQVARPASVVHPVPRPPVTAARGTPPPAHPAPPPASASPPTPAPPAPEPAAPIESPASPPVSLPLAVALLVGFLAVLAAVVVAY